MWLRFSTSDMAMVRSSNSSNAQTSATDPALRRLVSSFPQFRSPAVRVSGTFPGCLLHEVSTDRLFVACASMQAVQFSALISRERCFGRARHSRLIGRGHWPDHLDFVTE